MSDDNSYTLALFALCSGAASSHLTNIYGGRGGDNEREGD